MAEIKERKKTCVRYSPELGKRICKLVSECKFIYEVADLIGVSKRAIYEWKNSESKYYKREFAEMFKRAENEAGDKHMRRALDIVYDTSNDFIDGETKDGRPYKKANNAAVQRSKLQYEAERWCAGRRNIKWSQVQTVKHQGDASMPVLVKTIDSFSLNDVVKGEKKDMLTADRLSKVN